MRVRSITASARSLRSWVLACVGLVAWSACGATDDLIGLNYQPAGQGGQPRAGAPALEAGAAGAAGEGNVTRLYPNLFGELLGKTEAEISLKLEADFDQLFYGAPESESIYVEVGPDQAYVWDPRELEVRSDGFGNALLISVQLDRHAEFDRLWRWANAYMVTREGPLRDYVRAHCAVDGSTCDSVVVPGAHFSATTALWLAHGRWGSGGELDYAGEATRLMEATFRDASGELTEQGDLVGMVDPTRQLPRATPYASDSQRTASAVLDPAQFALWAEKSGDDRARVLAESARELLAKIAHPDTGLVPAALSLDGVPVPGQDEFSTSCYPVPLALGIDAVWFGSSTGHSQQVDRLLAFFREPLATRNFAVSYTLPGQPGSPLSDALSLEAPLGASAVAASVDYRHEFVQAVWDAELNTGTSRKYGNLLYLMSSLLLSGRYRVY